MFPNGLSTSHAVLVEARVPLLAQGVIQDNERVASTPAMGFRLLEHEPKAPAIDHVLPPGRLRDEAGKVGFVSTVQDAARHIGEALVRQDDEPGQLMLEMPKLALVLKQVPKGYRLLSNYGSWGNDRHVHHPPPSP
jgi:hypothetical protein